MSEQDHVYVLGDFIWNFKKNKDEALDVLHALTGKLHLIQGNHDYGIHMPEYRACFQEITSYKINTRFLAGEAAIGDTKPLLYAFL